MLSVLFERYFLYIYTDVRMCIKNTMDRLKFSDPLEAKVTFVMIVIIRHIKPVVFSYEGRD